ncbi:hypothetical protein [Serratia proteamaculans]|uniref:hypothetical protein n=1 Tax=Serratia proteamaculans TaxID=28151 RepID=UPI003D02C46F
MAVISQKKPSVMDLLSIFMIASALITLGTYLYAWSYDLAPQQEEIFKIISAAIPVPFGLAVAFVWWAFHNTITAAIGKIYASLVGVQQKVGAILFRIKKRFK